jgi:glycosyl transferase family 2
VSRSTGVQRKPQVSVIIPTTGRATLRQAVESALTQSAPPTEVIVVVDLKAPPDACAWTDPRVRVVCTGGGRGGSGARQMGVNLARGDVIAFLDDDDYWLEEKLERQLVLLDDARRRGRLAVIGAGVQVVDELGQPTGVVPRRAISEEQSLTNYLFKRREVAWGEATMGSSTLLVDRALLDAVPLDLHSLPLHQDWDWLVRASREAQVCFLMDSSPLLVYRRQPRGESLSRGSKWRCSLLWVESIRQLLSAREYGDLLVGVTVSIAVDAGDRRGGWSAFIRGMRFGRPGLPAMIAGGALLLVPQRLFDHLSRLRRALARGQATGSGADGGRE